MFQPFWVSYIFHKNIQPESIKCFFGVFTAGNLEIFYSSKAKDFSRNFYLSAILNNKGDKTDIQSIGRIFGPKGRDDTPRKCNHPVREPLHIWTHGDFVIIWSCQGVDELDYENNFGILLMTYIPNSGFRYRNDPRAFKALMGRFKPFAEQFLSEETMEVIPWDEDVSSDCQEFDPYQACISNQKPRARRSKLTGNNKSVGVLILVIFFLFLAVMALQVYGWK